MIKGYIRAGKLQKAKLLLDEMPYKNVWAQTAMMSGYAQNNRMDEARNIFNDIGAPDVVCWNTMIAGYMQSGKMDEALSLFQQMPQKNIDTWNTMISGYAQSGQMDKALQIFKEMGNKNTVSWNSLISGFSQNGLHVDALRLFPLMVRDGQRPDQSTFVSRLSSCANLATFQFGKELHQIVTKSGYVNDLFVCNALICMYAKCGRITDAEHVFSEVDSMADVITWNSFITGYALNGYGFEAVKTFQDMGFKGMVPDHITFVGILSACVHAGLVDQGLDLFRLMTEEYHIIPLIEHYACMVDLLCRAGRLEEAFRLVREMKTKANASIWGSLLGACRVHKELELGRLAFEKLSELEPCETSNYVLVSNMHAEAGRWNEGGRLRRLIRRDLKLESQPGLSWIEDKNQMQVFLSDNKVQPQTSNICGVLKILTAQMKYTGRV